MRKSVFTPHYDAFRERLVGMRKHAGLTQRGLAARLRREHSFVSRIEQGERRLDVVEFYWVCRACGADPILSAREAAADFAALDRAGDGGKRRREGRVLKLKAAGTPRRPFRRGR